jgi:oligoribonuclease NrnB/cAMP/cGMP phosphodiesterase (DHH superfamily)
MTGIHPTSTICIYHANCADGFGAAWVVRKALGGHIEFHAAKHGDPAPNVAGKEVIIVDFSYSLDTLLEMADVAASILVLDHHKTAQAALEVVPEASHCRACHCHSVPEGGLYALFDMQRSGAGITWDYFFPNYQRPALINHIEDRDLWRFKLDGTREIMASLFSYPFEFEVWDGLFAADPAALKAEGVALERKQQKDVAELVTGSMRRMKIGGFNVPVSNLPPTLASDAGNLMCADEPFAATYWDTSDGRVFSLRSTDEGMDVSAIAKQYGGGGHRNASGFKIGFDHALASPQLNPGEAS